jgi:hypothetical protein
MRLTFCAQCLTQSTIESFPTMRVTVSIFSIPASTHPDAMHLAAPQFSLFESSMSDFAHLRAKELLQQSIDDLDLLHDTTLACTTFRCSILNTSFIIKTIQHVISEPVVHLL